MGERSLTRLVMAAFLAWKSSGISFLVLRNYELLPDHVDNDLDILVAPAQARLAETILVAAAREAGYDLHNRAEFVPVSLFFHDQQTLEQVQVDLFTSLGFRCFEVLTTQEVLARGSRQALFDTPHPVDEALVNLLTRLLYQGCVKQKYQSGILETFRASPLEAQQRLAETFGPKHAAFLVDAVRAGQWEAIDAKASFLRRALIVRSVSRQPGRVLVRALRDVWRLLRRWMHPPGISIAVLGPDGCGKSTVLPGIVEGLKHTFAPGKGLQIHWKPTVFFRSRRRSGIPVTDPHGRPPRNPVASLCYLGFHWTEFLLGAWLQIHPATFRNGLAITDRHYYDFLVDPRRYRLNLPAGIIRLGAALLPKPDLVFLLDAPTEVLQSRKQEVPPAETEWQRQAFLTLVKSLNNGQVVDASRSPEEVAATIVRTVLHHLTGRAKSQDAQG